MIFLHCTQSVVLFSVGTLGAFAVMVGDSAPSDLFTMMMNYSQCVDYSGSLGTAARETINCSATVSGEYVGIMFSRITEDPLFFCDFEVYGTVGELLDQFRNN